MILFVIPYPQVFEARRQFSLLSKVDGVFAVYKDNENLNIIVQACLIIYLHIASLNEYCHNSKFGIFELLV
jgi:hypothetical protein